jgi:glycopeptide antibiotics resistance protein
MAEDGRAPEPPSAGSPQHWTHAAWWFVAGVVVGGVIALTIFPGSPAPYRWAADRLEPWADPAHLAAALNVLLFIPVGAMLAITARARWLWLAPAMSVAIETIQWVIPQRNPSLLDVALNTAGALLGYVIVATVRRSYEAYHARNGSS